MLIAYTYEYIYSRSWHSLCPDNISLILIFIVHISLSLTPSDMNTSSFRNKWAGLGRETVESLPARTIVRPYMISAASSRPSRHDQLGSLGQRETRLTQVEQRANTDEIEWGRDVHRNEKPCLSAFGQPIGKAVTDTDFRYLQNSDAWTSITNTVFSVVGLQFPLHSVSRYAGLPWWNLDASNAG